MNKKVKIFSLVVLIAAFAIGLAVVFISPGNSDPTGASYIATKGSETLREVTATANKAYYGSNFIWVMLTGFAVFFFQCGFAMVETGFCRGKNAAHVMTMNFMVFLVGAIGYFLTGFAFQFGGSGGAMSLGTGGSALNSILSIPGLGGIMGLKGFMLSGNGIYDPGIYALFFFQMVFMDTTVTIPTGAMAERVKYSAYIIIAIFISMFLYPLFGNWVWGGGWLSTLGKNFGLGHGVVDFAGSAVVHSMGGMIALAGAIVIGPRIGKFKKDGSAKAFPGHDIPMAIVGTIILFFCWFSFNAGSTLNASDFRLSVVATNTMIAGAIGGFAAMFYMWVVYGKPDPSMTANGTLAGLVAITAPCAFVNASSSFVIGLVAGILVCISVSFVENKLKIDDPVGAISVHCVNGIWGVLALGIFADGTYGDGLNGVTGNVTGLLYGDASQFIAQIIAIIVLIIWGFGVSYVFLLALNKVWGLRVEPAIELDGLDIPEMGVSAYPDMQLVKSELDYYSEDNAPVPQIQDFKTTPIVVTSDKPVSETIPVTDFSVSPATDKPEMSKVVIIMKQSKFEDLKIAMNKIGVAGMTVTNVLGCGIQKGFTEYYRGVSFEMNLLPKIQVDIVVSKVPVSEVVETARKVLYTGNIGDGKIFVYDVKHIVKVRTGETDFDALQNNED